MAHKPRTAEVAIMYCISQHWQASQRWNNPNIDLHSSLPMGYSARHARAQAGAPHQAGDLLEVLLALLPHAPG